MILALDYSAFILLFPTVGFQIITEVKFN